MKIAIDGTSGSGKTSIAKDVAKLLNIFPVNSGILYRVIACYSYSNNVTIQEIVANKLTDDFLEIDDDFKIKSLGECKNLYSQDENFINILIAVSSCVPIREYIVKALQKWSKERSIIMEGRDIGTVVLPDAKLKIFLKANVAIREARALERSKSNSSNEPSTTADNKERDSKDWKRHLEVAFNSNDYIHIDTTNRNSKEVAKEIANLAKKIWK